MNREPYEDPPGAGERMMWAAAFFLLGVYVLSICLEAMLK